MRKLLLLLSFLFANQTFALSGNPDNFYECPPGEVVTVGAFQKTQCYVDEEPYVPPDGYWRHPVAFMHKQGNPKADIKLLFSGWTAIPTYCTGNDYSEDGFVVVKSCAGHWPDVDQHQISGISLMGWWGYFSGLSNSWRLGLSATQALHFGGDLTGGLTLEGSSYGGTGVLLQSMLLKEADPFWGNQIEAVISWMPHTLFVENWPNDPSLNMAWLLADRSLADFRIQAQQGRLKNIYYRVNGSPADVVSNFDLDFFNICNQYKIACYGTWHAGGHRWVEQGINLPFLDDFPGPHSNVDIGSMLVVFTNSSANHWGARGHYNMGLEWHAGPYYLDTEDTVIVPLRYRPRYNMGGGIPDQPQSVTVDVTIRRIKSLQTSPGTQLNWQFGNQSGQVTTSINGEVTITGLDILGGDAFTPLVID
jgi:hypothetical protein